MIRRTSSSWKVALIFTALKIVEIASFVWLPLLVYKYLPSFVFPAVSNQFLAWVLGVNILLLYFTVGAVAVLVCGAILWILDRLFLRHWISLNLEWAEGLARRFK